MPAVMPECRLWTPRRRWDDRPLDAWLRLVAVCGYVFVGSQVALAVAMLVAAYFKAGG